MIRAGTRRPDRFCGVIIISEKGFARMAMNVSAVSQYLAAGPTGTQAGGESDEDGGFLDAVVKKYMSETSAAQKTAGGQRAEKDTDGGFWKKRMDGQKKRMELLEEEWVKKQLMEARQRRQIITGPDGEKKEYAAGVPASVLLSMLM